MSEEEDRTTEHVDEDLNDSYQELLDVNQQMLMMCREKAHHMRQLQHLFLEQATRCEEIAQLHVEGAMLLGDVIGDILSSEWGVTQEDEEDEDADV